MKKKLQVSMNGGLLSLYSNWQAFVITLLLASPLFVVFFYAMSQLPAVHPGVQACFVGGAFTFGNFLFSLIVSLLTGVMVFASWSLGRRRRASRPHLRQFFSQKSFKSNFGSLLGILASGLGFMTVFCTACTIPVLTVFGASVGLIFLTTYSVLFKSISLSMMCFALWLVDQQLKGECERCVF